MILTDDAPASIETDRVVPTTGSGSKCPSKR